MTYQKLLRDKNWLEKRKLIVERDCSQCQNCQNNEIVKVSQVGTIVNLSCEDNQVTALLNRSDSRFRVDRPKYKIRFSLESSSEERQSTVYIYGWFNQSSLNELIGSPVYYSFVQEDQLQDSDKKKWLTINGIKRTKGSLDDWFHVNNLHVHHKYYQQGKLPWEYPDSSLITLCWNCHKALHQKETVPYLNENGQEIGRMTCCVRCYGAGYFPQYDHIENGICFRCWGAKYEELV